MNLRTSAELTALVQIQLQDIDALIVASENQIVKLAESKNQKVKEVRAWHLGVLKGLRLARAAWSWWL